MKPRANEKRGSADWRRAGRGDDEFEGLVWPTSCGNKGEDSGRRAAKRIVRLSGGGLTLAVCFGLIHVRLLGKPGAPDLFAMPGARRFDIAHDTFDFRFRFLVGYPSGQRGQTVNLLAYAFDGSNPSPTTTQTAGNKALLTIILHGLRCERRSFSKLARRLLYLQNPTVVIQKQHAPHVFNWQFVSWRSRSPTNSVVQLCRVEASATKPLSQEIEHEFQNSLSGTRTQARSPRLAFHWDYFGFWTLASRPGSCGGRGAWGFRATDDV